jgi:hypothetical protein
VTVAGIAFVALVGISLGYIGLIFISHLLIKCLVLA